MSLFARELRSIRWGMPAIAAVAGACFLGLAAISDSRSLAARFAALSLAVGAVFVADDLGDEAMMALPCPLVRRVASRWLACFAVGAPAAWSLQEVAGTTDVAVEFAGLAAIGFMLGVVAARFRSDRYGQLAAATLVLAFLLSWALPDAFSPWRPPLPGEPGSWVGGRWVAVAATATIATAIVGWDGRSR